MLSCLTETHDRWVTCYCILMCECESWACICLSILVYMFLWEGVSVHWSTAHICKCISLYQPRSLLTPHTVVSLTGLPEAEPNERISIWQEWILNCARTGGWISRDGASFQRDLQKMFEERVLWGKLGEWELESKIWLLSSFQLQENPHDVTISVLRNICSEINGVGALY